MLRPYEFVMLLFSPPVNGDPIHDMENARIVADITLNLFYQLQEEIGPVVYNNNHRSHVLTIGVGDGSYKVLEGGYVTFPGVS